MKIEQVKIAELKPAEYNPREMTEKQAKDLEASLREFGFVDPIVVNKRNGVIVGGHQRVNVAKMMGMTEVPVVYVDLDEEKERELNLRLNKNSGQWDWDLLANFDENMLEGVGFSKEEMEKVFDLRTSEDEFDASKEYADIVRNNWIDINDKFIGGNWVVDFGDHSAQGNDYYSCSAYGFYAENKDTKEEYSLPNLPSDSDYDVEIIGNIYENPELIKK